MSWHADQIYTLPNSKLIEELQTEDYFRGKLFLVNNLEGIRSTWTREFMLDDISQDDERLEMRHTLPQGGLLAIEPHLYKTGYDNDYDGDFWELYQESGDKWDFRKRDNTPQPLDLIESSSLDLNNNQLQLFAYLDDLSKKYKTPFVYYHCYMWGGSIDVEFSVVFNKGEIHVYDYSEETEVSILPQALQHLGLHLPTFFFALHEGSFDWKRYFIHA